MQLPPLQIRLISPFPSALAVCGDEMQKHTMDNTTVRSAMYSYLQGH